MAPPKQLNFITGNKNKLLESQAILGGIVDLRNQPLDLVEIQGTIEEIITDKCRRAADAVSLPLYIKFSNCAYGIIRSKVLYLWRIRACVSMR
jgi:inosine triphosphate pyrophosphatase